ncbi:unnamed protein product [Candidula unifasciata]|uniref:Phenylalanine--tRNA ligase alpha subunit n=1 Tax=Candidula unifasciata TaxID=100452 RepID=A0A8S3ZHT7_9EUPU|nr:unnamed protein product [Candidula unifasciata]
MADLVDVLLQEVDSTGSVDSLDLSRRRGVNHQVIVGAIKSLQSLGNIIKVEDKQSKRWQLTEEGVLVLQKGSHEAVLFGAIPKEGIDQAKLMNLVPNAKVGFSKAMSAGWIKVDKAAKDGPKVFRQVDSIEDTVKLCLERISNLKLNDVTEEQKKDFKKRKLIAEVKEVSYVVTKGENFTTVISKPVVDLTPEMISSGSWKTTQFKPYNFNALGVPAVRGHLHPLLKVREQYRQIFLEMGFSEMPTNNYIESSFWNFDALFQPQQHPARDAHDTFFLSEPANASAFPMDYLDKVKEVHSNGGYGSQGYKYDWKLEEAEKNILRTHTTAVSARMLYKLALEVQTAHLLRFKPAYNPYTEPSMEIFSYHEGLKKWVEVGNSGMFRPEMLLPMGLPSDVSVIAWGLSLERPTMIKYGIDNIRELVGPKVNLKMVYDNPICRLDKR